MWLGRLVCTFAFAIGIGSTAPLAAQTENGNNASSQATVRVFFDCADYGACSDFDYFRREVPYVNWMRDRQDADVHVLVTQQATGGGGRQYTLAFIGLGVFEGQDQRLIANTPGAATLDEQRHAIAGKLELGLVLYLSQTAAAEQLRVTYGPPPGPGGSPRPGRPPPGGPGASPATEAQNDPWNYWVFSLNGRVYLSGQSSYKTSSYYGSVNASRTTEAWKISLGVNYNLGTDEYDLSEGPVSETQRAWGVTSSAVKSIGPQWSLGLRGDLGRSDYYNQDLKWALRPGLEYDVFPYRQSSRRLLALQYLVGPEHWNYHEGTIYERASETRVQESLTARLSLIQPWGQWTTALTGAHYLPETSKYHVSLNGQLNVRIFKGLSIQAYAYYTWLHDQIYLSAGGVTDEQTLLHLRQLYTTHTYSTSIGFQYRFGSIFNNVVNPRFGSSSTMVIIG
jgi:hypothetical protein